MSRDSQRLEPIIDKSVQAIKAVLESEEKSDGEIVAARIGSSVLATWAKLKQSERAQEAVYFGMASALASDRDELARYIKLTLPDTPLAQQIETKRLPKPK